MDLYKKETQIKFPQDRANKYIYEKDLEPLIDEYIETGEHTLGVQLVRLLHWQRDSAKEISRIVSENMKNLTLFEYYMGLDADEKQALMNVGEQRTKQNLINKFYGIRERLIGYDEIKQIIESED